MAGGINDTFRQVGVAIGTAAWGALLLDRGADTVRDLAVGVPAASGDGARELVEAASTGAITANPPPAQAAVADAAGLGFLAGLNAILLAGAALSLVGAIVAIWLLRTHRRQAGPHGTVPGSLAGHVDVAGRRHRP